MSLKSFIFKTAKTVGKFADKNAPELLTAAAGVGVIMTATLMVPAVKKALMETENERIYREEQAEVKAKRLYSPRSPKYRKTVDELTEPITKWEVVKMTWPHFIPPFLMGTATITALIFSNRVSAKRHAALLASYELAQTALKDYQRKVIEKLGENKERAIRHDIHKDEIDKNPPSEKIMAAASDSLFSETIFYDPKTGQYFVSTIEKVKRAFIKANNELRNGYEQSLNDVLYDAGEKYCDLAWDWIFVPAPNSCMDVIDIDRLCDPHIEEYHGHEVTVVYLDYEATNRIYL